MTSTIKVDTISEKTSANGVAIDSLGIKDGKITNLMNATLSAADLGSGIHIKTADSGQSAAGGNGDELVLESDGECGLSILSGASANGNIFFGDSGGSATGIISYNHANNYMAFNTNGGNERVRINDSGNVGIGETNPDAPLHITSNTPIISFDESDASQEFRIGSFGGSFAVLDVNDNAFRFLINGDGDLSTGGETAPDCDPGGLCLNQGANDANILTFKSSDVSHGFTGQFDADTYGVIKKTSSSLGGLTIQGMAEDDPGVTIFGIADTSSGTVASNTNAIIHIDARKTTGGSVGTIGSDMLCLFSNDGVAKVIFTGAGNIHSDASATVGTYDEYEDAHLVRAYDLSHGKGVIDSKFDKFISYNAEKLADLELIGRDDDGTPNSFVNVTGFQKLHNGAIWQQYEKHQRLASAFYKLAEKTIGKEEADKLLTEEEIKLLN